MIVYVGMENELYSEYILDHARKPRNNKKIVDSIAIRVDNPVCGDELTLYITFSNNKVVDCSFESLGCALSTASGSLSTEYFKNKTLSELKLITPGDIYALFGISVNPNRSSCVLLTYSALEKYLKNSMLH